MDTSKVDELIGYALKGREIDGNILTPEQWLKIVNGVLAAHKAHVKYWVAIWDHRYAIEGVQKITSWSVPWGGRTVKFVYPENTPALTKDTRLHPIAPIFAWDVGWSPEEEHWHDNAMDIPFVFLTDDLVWVTLTAHYVKNGQDVVPVQYDFALVTEQQLIDIVGNRPRKWWMIVRSLQALAQEAIKEKQSHIQRLLDATAQAELILERISPPDA